MKCVVTDLSRYTGQVPRGERPKFSVHCVHPPLHLPSISPPPPPMGLSPPGTPPHPLAPSRGQYHEVEKGRYEGWEITVHRKVYTVHCTVRTLIVQCTLYSTYRTLIVECTLYAVCQNDDSILPSTVRVPQTKLVFCRNKPSQARPWTN